ncbi:hypothetical protein Tco_0313109 [Tanacetum coccineum]
MYITGGGASQRPFYYQVSELWDSRLLKQHASVLGAAAAMSSFAREHSKKNPCLVVAEVLLFGGHIVLNLKQYKHTNLGDIRALSGSSACVSDSGVLKSAHDHVDYASVKRIVVLKTCAADQCWSSVSTNFIVRELFRELNRSSRMCQKASRGKWGLLICNSRAVVIVKLCVDLSTTPSISQKYKTESVLILSNPSITKCKYAGDVPAPETL